MTLRTCSSLAFWALTAAALGPVGAKADTLNVLSVGSGIRGVPMVHGSSWAVQINITVNGQPFTAYCVDLFTSIGYGAYSTTPSAPSTLVPSGPRLAWIFENYAPLVASAPNRNRAAAALQLALWDVRHDGGDGLANGVIQLTTSYRTMNPGVAILAAADAIVDASEGQSSTQASLLYNFSFNGNPAQTLIIDGDWPEPTPEPSTFVMMGVGAAACAGIRRWKSARPPAS